MPRGNADYEAGVDAGLNGEPDPGGNANFTAGYKEGAEIRNALPDVNSNTGESGCGLNIFLWLVGLVVSLFLGGFSGVGLYIVATILLTTFGRGVRSSKKRG